MQFTTLSFLLFASLTLLFYFTAPKAKQWWVLLAASYIFYLFAGITYLPFLLYTTTVTYFTARIMQKRADAEDAYVAQHRDIMDKSERKAYRAGEKKRRFKVLLVGLFLGFGLLAILKYTAFAITGVNSICNAFGAKGFTVPSLLLPLGISFYTFQSMGYLIDVYRKKTRAETNPARLALFVSFFPQIIQGPISRHDALANELFVPHRFNGLAFRSGLCRVAWGFFKKLVIADTALIGVKELVGKTPEFNGVYVLILIVLYSIQIYGDFTGGIDITIGLSEAMGIRLAENFNRPFSSRSTKEYWRRWHITMGSWFTDYVFYPLSVCLPMQRLSKWSRAHLGAALGKRLPVYLATTVTWFLTGLWHGAGWNFIVWGLLNCAVILISQELQPLYDRFHHRFPRLTASGGWIKWQMVRTFLLMGLIRSLDVYRDVPRAFAKWGTMLTVWNWDTLFKGGLFSFGLSVYDLSLLLGGVLLMWAVSRIGTEERPCRRIIAERPILFCAGLCAATVIILLFGAYGIGYDASQFIYNQF
ncbi:MAG: MBOAT family protein [Ruminococcaceae bacterium]|nr:MBOAT family protein [Oscillospiraceae bacterium]